MRASASAWRRLIAARKGRVALSGVLRLNAFYIPFRNGGHDSARKVCRINALRGRYPMRLPGSRVIHKLRLSVVPQTYLPV